MTQLQTRLAKLEGRSGIGTDQVTVIVRRFMAPGASGPTDTGRSLVRVIGTREQFRSEDFASEAEMWAAVNACHEWVHGCRLEGKPQ